MTLGELRQRMSSAEIGLWRAYWRIDPKNEDRADRRNAMLMQLVHEFARQGKGQSRKAADFLVYDVERYRSVRGGVELDAQTFAGKWKAAFK